MSTPRPAYADAPRSNAASSPGAMSGMSLLRGSAACALIDRDGMIVASNAAFDGLLPGGPGTALAGQFIECDGIAHVLAQGEGILHVTYRHATRGCAPATLQLLPLGQGESERMLAVLTDGMPVRDAEARRFEATPCPIVRVCAGGNITFANSHTMHAFGHDPALLVGMPLTNLFDPADTERVSAAISECILCRCARTLEVVAAPNEQRRAKPVVLTVTPDPAPSGPPLGALVVIQAATQTVRDKIRRIALEAEELPRKARTRSKSRPTRKLRQPPWQPQFNQMLEQIRTVIEFDHATFGVYDEKTTLFRAEALYPPGSVEWPARWMSLPKGIDKFLASDDTSIDLDDFLVRFPEMRDNEVVRYYIKFGVKSSVSFVICEGGRPTSALSLCSFERGKYSKADCESLREFDLEPVLLRYEDHLDTERREFCASVRTTLDEPIPLSAAAMRIVDAIADHFSWDYVGLFRVNRHRKLFELFYQAPSRADFLLPENYTQDIGEGMLASTLEAQRVRIVHEIGARRKQQYGYVQGARGGPGSRKLRSAMTIPIRLNGRVRWILNIECEASDAFRGPDEMAIREVVGSVEQGLNHRMLNDMKACLFKETDRGVIVVGTEGAILDMNDAAEAMLDVEKDDCVERNVRLSELAADEHSRDVLESPDYASKRRVELKNGTGRNKVAIATRIDLHQSFDTSVWFLTDVEGVEWNRSLRFLRDTVTEVAQQARAPLALASMLANELPRAFMGRKAAERPVSREAQTLTTQLVAEINKADISFERLAEATSIRMNPVRSVTSIDLRRCVNDVLECLPERDRRCIDVPAATLVFVQGDVGRLTYVIRSIVAHLLRVRRGDAVKVKVSIQGDARYAHLVLKIGEPGSPASEREAQAEDVDALLAASREAREAVRLSLGSIRRIVRAHHGTLKTSAGEETESDGSPRWIGFDIKLPKHPTDAQLR